VGNWELLSHSAEETISRGREIGSRLRPPVLVLLSGDLGAGKTTLTKGLVSGLGASSEEEVTSPTFTLVHTYRNRSLVYHVDLYRVEGVHDVETLGLEDILSEPAVVIVEWAEKLTLRTDWPVVRICLEHVEEPTRRIEISDPTGALRSATSEKSRSPSTS
jgi:tRNA threonylcarbamoyladenosine biosynthesis protein TsaE